MLGPSLARRPPGRPGPSCVSLYRCTARRHPRHILFNNLSLLNYLLAFATYPPASSSVLTSRLSPRKQQVEATETSVYL